MLAQNARFFGLEKFKNCRRTWMVSLVLRSCSLRAPVSTEVKMRMCDWRRMYRVIGLLNLAASAACFF